MERFTKIVCTIGPASENYPGLKDMISSGMDVARLNFSHDSHAVHLRQMKLVKKAAKAVGKRVAILQDLPGPKIRVGTILKEPILLKTGSEVIIRCGAETNIGTKVIPVPFEGLADAVEKGSSIYLVDGAIKLRVKNVNGKDILCLIEVGGELKTHKGVNIPETTRKIPAVTPEDERHISFGVKNKVDYIAVSFVRSADDIEYARRIISKYGSGNRIQIVAKIEKQEAIRNYKEIIRAADVVMVARGDLGVEIGLENVPLAQKMIIREANRQGKPVITATQMLLSMVKNKSPTRAEVSDAANAILDGTNALMLSEETTIGDNYREAVKVLERISKTMEADSTFDKKERMNWRP
jgi:pyruvate kinase